MFNAYFQLDKNARDGASYELQKFFARQCAPIISHRLRCYKYIFTEPLYDILKDWKPSESDHLTYKADPNHPNMFPVTGILHSAAEYQGIRYKEADGKTFYYEGTKDTAPHWIRFLCDMLRRAETCFTVGTQLPPDAVIRRGAITLIDLHFLLELPWFNALFGLRSIKALLEEAANKRSSEYLTLDSECTRCFSPYALLEPP